MPAFPLEPNLPELAADVADVRFLDVEQAHGFDQFGDPGQARAYPPATRPVRRQPSRSTFRRSTPLQFSIPDVVLSREPSKARTVARARPVRS
jgi:hypothetical protein